MTLLTTEIDYHDDPKRVVIIFGADDSRIWMATMVKPVGRS